MISYIKGKFAYKSPVYLIVETAGGVGYHINITLPTFSKIETLTEGLIYTHLSVKEDSHTLYGFFEESERTMFIHLISVSGVGPNTARLVLSSMPIDELRAAIVHENTIAIGKVKGIGPKTAKQIVLDLKEKITKEVMDQPLLIGGGSLLSDNPMREEALQALVALGFVRLNVQKALNKILKEKTDVKSVEELIKLGLRTLSGN